MLLSTLVALSSRCGAGQPAVSSSPAVQGKSGQGAAASDLLATLRTVSLTEVRIVDGDFAKAVAGLNHRLETEPPPARSVRLRLDASLTPRIAPYYAPYVSMYDIRRGCYAKRVPLEDVVKMLADMSHTAWRVEKGGVVLYDPRGPRDARIDFSSVRAIQINAGFPKAEKIWEELVGLGALLRDDLDWFGPSNNDRWEICIAPYVEVKAAQGILAACVRRSPKAMSSVCVVLDPSLADRQVMIGPLIRTSTGPMRGSIERVLEAGLSRSAFHELLGPHK